MKRYNVETHDLYDMEPATDGAWVLHDDAQAAIAAAVAAERERLAQRCEQVAAHVLEHMTPNEVALYLAGVCRA